MAAAREAALKDAQTVAEIVLEAEARLGEILAKTDKTDSHLRGKNRGCTGATTIKTLPEGVDKKMSHEVQQIHKHADIVARSKRAAREKGEIVNRDLISEPDLKGSSRV